MPDKYTDLPLIRFMELSQQANCILLDVRTNPEFADFHFQNALNIDIKDRDFTSEIEELDPEKKYFVYCNRGIRSVNACILMSKIGFQHLYNLKGGIQAYH